MRFLKIFIAAIKINRDFQVFEVASIGDDDNNNDGNDDDNDDDDDDDVSNGGGEINLGVLRGWIFKIYCFKNFFGS